MESCAGVGRRLEGRIWVQGGGSLGVGIVRSREEGGSQVDAELVSRTRSEREDGKELEPELGSALQPEVPQIAVPDGSGATGAKMLVAFTSHNRSTVCNLVAMDRAARNRSSSGTASWKSSGKEKVVASSSWRKSLRLGEGE